MKYSHIIWDWNGTLLDDVKWCMQNMNKMLSARNKRIIGSLTEYHNAFCFPVIDYYKNVGFDFEDEPFETLAKEYIDLYHGEKGYNLQLHKNAEAILKYIALKNISQIVLSASFQKNLDEQISPFNIQHFFNQILGISDIYGKSKIDIGKKYIAKTNIQRAVLIGDTTHDFDVSQALEIDCLLVAHGHQSWEKLCSCNVPVVKNLDEVLYHIE